MRVQGKKSPRSDRWVTIYLGGKKTELFADTGSRFYHSRMDQVKEAKCILRAWGNNKTLDVKGMVRAEIRTIKGAKKRRWVYTVGGT